MRKEESEPLQPSDQPVVQANKLVKSYPRGSEIVHAVVDIDVEIQQGEYVAIVGASGSGKTTLLQLLGGMDRPTSGTISIAGKEISKLSDRELTRLRREQLGFVFQHFGLLSTLTVAENVALPAILNHKPNHSRVDELLERTGIIHRRNHRPSELSGGEMQRVAIARALINEPKLLLADEPTGNLDSATSERILELIGELNKDGLTIVVVTHNEKLAQCAHRIIQLSDGRIVNTA